MVRSRLPVPSLLGLFVGLLMLFPELLMGSSEDLSVVPVTDEEVQKALAVAVERYNQEIRCAYYFKQLRLQKALTKGDTGIQYHLKVEMAITGCSRRRSSRLDYEGIQGCQISPRNQERRLCYFVVSPRLPPTETIFKIIACTPAAPS